MSCASSATLSAGSAGSNGTLQGERMVYIDSNDLMGRNNFVTDNNDIRKWFYDLGIEPAQFDPNVNSWPIFETERPHECWEPVLKAWAGASTGADWDGRVLGILGVLAGNIYTSIGKGYVCWCARPVVVFTGRQRGVLLLPNLTPKEDTVVERRPDLVSWEPLMQIHEDETSIPHVVFARVNDEIVVLVCRRHCSSLYVPAPHNTLKAFWQRVGDHLLDKLINNRSRQGGGNVVASLNVHVILLHNMAYQSSNSLMAAFACVWCDIGHPGKNGPGPGWLRGDFTNLSSPGWITLMARKGVSGLLRHWMEDKMWAGYIDDSYAGHYRWQRMSDGVVGVFHHKKWPEIGDWPPLRMHL